MQPGSQIVFVNPPDSATDLAIADGEAATDPGRADPRGGIIKILVSLGLGLTLLLASCGNGAYARPTALPYCFAPTFTPMSEGATGGVAVYYIEITTSQACRLDIELGLSVVSADGNPVDVAGSPINTRLTGIVDDGFAPQDGSTPQWTLRNWCREEGEVRFQIDGIPMIYSLPASGHCDDPDEPPVLAPTSS